MFLRKKIGKSTTDCWKEIEKLEKQIQQADAIIIGAGAGLSTSAGFHYAGERFKEYFGDFANRYHFIDMYSGGFIHMRHWKNIGHIGADIFTSIDIWMHRIRFIIICIHWLKKKTILY